MKLKQIVIILLWISGVLLAMFPELCGGLSVCKKSPFTLIVIIGVIGSILILSDAKIIRKKVLENMEKNLKSNDEKSKKQDGE